MNTALIQGHPDPRSPVKQRGMSIGSY